MINKFLRINGTMHYPVMYPQINQMVDQFIRYHQDTKANFQMADCTFGGGGHSIQLLNDQPKLKVLGCDLDPNMIEHCSLEY